VKLAGAADPQTRLRQRFESDFGIQADNDVAGLAERSEIDVLYIATPQQLHAEHVQVAARHGKHVVVEKPMALSHEDCNRMIAAAEAADCVLLVGHTHGFDPAIAAIRELTEGALGRPRLLHGFNYTNFMYRPRRPEELDRARGGGVLWNQMPHQFDALRLIVGRPVRSVRATTLALDAARAADGACTAFIDFEDGAVANVVYSGYDYFDSDEWFGWVGASGNAKKPAHGAARQALRSLDTAQELIERQSRWSYGGDARRNPLLIGQPHFGHLIVSCERGEARLTPQGLMIYTAEGAREISLPSDGDRPSHRAVWDELAAAVIDGEKPVHDGVFARGTVDLCVAVAESARIRREILLN
jgi:phthalate 4,5-cis-dihydrodiol dehydrogenase